MLQPIWSDKLLQCTKLIVLQWCSDLILQRGWRPPELLHRAAVWPGHQHLHNT